MRDDRHGDGARKSRTGSWKNGHRFLALGFARTALAVLTGLALSINTIWKSSATYDEVAYLRVAARWWRTGDQAEITRMGSPLTFWKLQQVPVLWLLDHLGRREWIDDPIGHQRQLLPLVRLGSLWIWLTGLCTRRPPGAAGAMVPERWLWRRGFLPCLPT